MTYWNDETKFAHELGPVTGTAPHLNPAFDEDWDIDDLMAFILMYNWSPNTGIVLQFVEEYGITPEVSFVNDDLIMSLAGFEEDIQYVWVSVHFIEDDITFMPSDFAEQFELALNRNHSDDHVNQTLLINFESIHDGSDLNIGTIFSSSRQNRHLELQYKIKSKTSLLSSGSMLLDYLPTPEEFELSPAYPNPFNPTTTIKYGLPMDANITLSIYNLQGRLVQQLSNGFIDAGYHETIWNASIQSSGLYFIQVKAFDIDGKNVFESTQKIMLVK